MRLTAIGLATCGAVVSWACRTSEARCGGGAAQRAVGSWRLGIRVPDSVRSGDAVPLALVLWNVGDSAADPRLGLPADEDFVVTRAGDATQVWSKRHGLRITMGTLRKGRLLPVTVSALKTTGISAATIVSRCLLVCIA